MTQLALVHPLSTPLAPLYDQPTDLARFMSELSLRLRATLSPKQFAVAEAPPAPSIEQELALKRAQAKDRAQLIRDVLRALGTPKQAVAAS